MYIPLKMICSDRQVIEVVGCKDCVSLPARRSLQTSIGKKMANNKIISCRQQNCKLPVVLDWADYNYINIQIDR